MYGAREVRGFIPGGTPQAGDDCQNIGGDLGLLNLAELSQERVVVGLIPAPTKNWTIGIGRG
jgi:hypothetical protein